MSIRSLRSLKNNRVKYESASVKRRNKVLFDALELLVYRGLHLAFELFLLSIQSGKHNKNKSNFYKRRWPSLCESREKEYFTKSICLAALGLAFDVHVEPPLIKLQT